MKKLEKICINKIESYVNQREFFCDECNGEDKECGEYLSIKDYFAKAKEKPKKY